MSLPQSEDEMFSRAGAIADEFTDRVNRGERPDIDDYVRRHPELEDVLLPILEAVLDLQSRHAVPDATTDRGQTTGGGVGHTPDRTGTDIPGYAILEELGRGGMGVVHKARQTAAGRVVALKMILPGALPGTAALDRFRVEARSVARLQHPNIVQIFEVGEHAGAPYFSLEFCPGGALNRRLAGEPMPARPAAELVSRIARGVAAAHDKGIVHRDLKPANVLFAEDGTPKIADFGLAKKLDDDSARTSTGAVVGTPSYMAPEQAAGSKEVGPPADVYALGVILYECLTGRPPFKGTTVLDTLDQVRNQEPVPPRQLNGVVPRDLETVCMKCLRKESAKRYPTASELADDLERFLAGRPVAARPVGRPEKLGKWVRRNPVPAALAAVIFLVALTGLGGVLWQMDETRREADARAVELQGRVDAEKGQAEAEREKSREEQRRHEAEQTATRQKLADAEELRKTEQARAKAVETLLLEQQERVKAYEARESGDHATFMNTSAEAVQANNLPLARSLLERCPERMRDFGWHHLNNRVAESAVHLPVPQLLSAHLLPDGRGVVSLRQEGGPPGKDPLRTKAIVWDLTRQSPVREWAVRGRPRLSALSPDGTRIAFDASNTIEVHDLKEGKLVRALPRPAGGSLLNLTFLGDGTVVGHCFDLNSNFLQLWDVAGGKPTRTVPLREQAQSGIFTVDGTEFRLYAFAGREQIVETYSLTPNAKNPRAAITLPPDGIFLTLTPDGNRSVCYRHLPVREAAVVVVDNATRQILARWALDTGTYPRVACHPGLPLVAFSRENRVHVGDVSSGRIVQTFTYPATDTLALRFSSDGASLFAVQKDGCRLWGLEQKAPVRTVLFPPGSLGGHPQVDPTGNYHLTTVSSRGARGKSPLVSFADDRLLLEDVPNLQRLHFSQDAKRLLVGESHQFTVYEFPEMKSVYRVERLALQGFEPVPRTPLGVDGRQLALFRRKVLSATEQALELKVVRLPDGKEVAQLSLPLKKDNSTVLDWVVDPRGERVLISRQEVKGKEVESILEEHFLADREVRRLYRQQHTARMIWAPAYSPDGSRVVAFTGQCLGTGQEIELRAWDAKTGKEAWRVSGTSGAGFHALRVHFSCDGKWLATGMIEKGKTTLIVPATGDKHLTVDGIPGAGLMDELPVFSPDGTAIVVLDKPAGTTVAVRSVQTGKVLSTLEDHRQCEMAGFGLHTPALITSDFDAQNKTARARIWSAKDGKLIGQYPGDHPRPSGEYGVREGSTEERVGAQVHRLGEKRALWSRNFAADVRGPERLTVRGEFDPQGRRVALVDWFGKEVVVCDAATGAVLHRRKQVCPDQGHVQVMRFDPAGEMLFVGVSRSREDRGLMLGWNLAADSVTTYELPPKESVFDVAFLPDGERVLGISATGLVHVWNLKTGAAFPSFEGKPLAWKWRIPRLSPDGRFLGVQSRGATDDAFLLWDTRTGRRVALEDTAGLHPRAATFSEDSRQVVMAVQDGGKKNSIMIWNLFTGTRVRHIAGLAGDPLALELTDKGRRCLVVGADRISFWDLQSGLKVMDFPRPGGETGILGGRLLERSQILVQFTNREVTLYDGSRRGEGPRASEIPR